MTVSPARILTQRELSCMAAVDTMPHITTRIRNLLAHGRRITVTRRYTYVNDPPEVTAGLTMDEIRTWANERGAGIGVYLKPGLLAGFGVSAHAGENDTEQREWKRYHVAEATSDDHFKRRRDMTRIDVTGGLPGNGPARDDQIVIRHWNRDGVCDERVIAFDYGLVDARTRIARRLFVTTHPTLAHREAEDEWDFGKPNPESVEAKYATADDLLAAMDGGR